MALVEREDFGCGASGQTSKLLHGGLRYLAQGHVRLVREALRERARVLAEANAAWSRREPFLLPLRGGRGRVLRDRLGTWVYERLAFGHHLGPRRVVGASEVLERVPWLDPRGLRGGVLYSEAIVDDAALTWSRVEEAVAGGAVALNHVEALRGRTVTEGGFRVELRDRLQGQRIEASTRALVDATGAWMGRAPLVPSTPRLAPSKGIHLVFRRERLPLDIAVVLEGPDGRPAFALPYGSLLIVGTTDTEYPGDPALAGVERSDVEYLIETLRRAFPRVGLARSDVVDAYAGVRPLLSADAASPSERSREDIEVFDPRGAVAVAGGKLTTHRAMAERVLSLLPLGAGRGAGKHSRGPETSPTGPPGPRGESRWAAPSELISRLTRAPGAADEAELRERVGEAIHVGMAETLEDLLDRRLHSLTRHEKGFEAVISTVADLLGESRNAPPADRQDWIRSYRAQLRRAHGPLEATADG